MEFEACVEDIVVRASSVKSFRFARPVGFDYKAGQFMFVTLEVGKQMMRKPFTISSSPTEEEFIEFTKKFTGHPFSNGLDVLKVGDLVKLDAPHGDFTFEGEFSKIGLLSGGIGITPLRSMCKFCADRHLSTKVTLIYGNRTEAGIAFREEFEAMQRHGRDFKVVFTLNEAGAGWSGLVGKIDVDMVKREIPDYLETVFYICGPPAMVEAMDALLGILGVSEENVKKENFVGY